MKGQLTKSFILLTFLLYLCCFCAYAEDDIQQWTSMQIMHKVNDKTQLALYTRFEVADDISQANTLLFRPFILFKLKSGYSAGLGYEYVDNLRFKGRFENRIWQQIAFAHPAKNYQLSNRLRIEERFIDEIAGPVVRARYLIGAIFPLKDTNWYPITSNEIFFNLNDKNEGPPHGFDQNRFLVGIGKNIGESSSIQVGYMYRVVDLRKKSVRNDHIALLSLFF